MTDEKKIDEQPKADEKVPETKLEKHAAKVNLGERARELDIKIAAFDAKLRDAVDAARLEARKADIKMRAETTGEVGKLAKANKEQIDKKAAARDAGKKSLVQVRDLAIRKAKSEYDKAVAGLDKFFADERDVANKKFADDCLPFEEQFKTRSKEIEDKLNEEVGKAQAEFQRETNHLISERADIHSKLKARAEAEAKSAAEVEQAKKAKSRGGEETESGPAA
jgi:hypothetical protein